MDSPFVYSAVRGYHSLSRDKPAEQTTVAITGVAKEHVAIKLVQLEQLEKLGEISRRLRRHRGRFYKASELGAIAHSPPPMNRTIGFHVRRTLVVIIVEPCVSRTRYLMNDC
jgi:hypothetical protein